MLARQLERPAAGAPDKEDAAETGQLGRNGQAQLRRRGCRLMMMMMKYHKRRESLLEEKYHNFEFLFLVASRVNDDDDCGWSVMDVGGVNESRENGRPSPEYGSSDEYLCTYLTHTHPDTFGRARGESSAAERFHILNNTFVTVKDRIILNILF